MSEQPTNIPDELQVSRSREPIFRKYVYRILDRDGYARENDIINSGAEVAEISPVTARRYLAKMCSSEGKCQIYCINGPRCIRYKRELSVSSTS